MFPFLQTNITSQMWPSGGKGGGGQQTLGKLKLSTLRKIRRNTNLLCKQWNIMWRLNQKFIKQTCRHILASHNIQKWHSKLKLLMSNQLNVGYRIGGGAPQLCAIQIHVYFTLLYYFTVQPQASIWTTRVATLLWPSNSRTFREHPLTIIYMFKDLLVQN